MPPDASDHAALPPRHEDDVDRAWLSREREVQDPSFAPTRSARTPLVAEPREHRLENPVLHDAVSAEAG